MSKLMFHVYRLWPLWRNTPSNQCVSSRWVKCNLINKNKRISTFAWYPLITKHKSCGNSTHFQWEEHLLHEKFSAKVQKFALGQEVFGCDKSDSYRPSGKAHRGTGLASPADPCNPRKWEIAHPIDFGWLIKIIIIPITKLPRNHQH